MSQNPAPRRHLSVQFRYTEPSALNGAPEDADNIIVGMFSLDCTGLRNAREISAIAVLRMESILADMLDSVDKATREYNEQHPVEETPAPETREEKEVEFQA